MPVPAAFLAAAPIVLPKLLEYAPALARYALGLLPQRAQAVMTKVVNTVHRTASVTESVSSALRAVTTAGDENRDLTQAEADEAIAAMGAAVDAFNAHADVRRQEAEKGQGG